MAQNEKVTIKDVLDASKKSADKLTPSPSIKRVNSAEIEANAGAEKNVQKLSYAKEKKLRRGRGPENTTVTHFLKNPQYTQYRESNKFANQEKLGRVEECLYGFDFGILPMDLEWYIQAHPVLALICSFLLILSIVFAVCSVGYIFRNIIIQMPSTFGWRSVASTYLIPLLPIKEENCTTNFKLNRVHIATPYSHYICLGPIILVQASCVVFLTWKSFKAYTLQIAVFFLRLQNWFLAIDLIHVCLEFINALSSLRAEMALEMRLLTPNGVTGWWLRTQKDSKCCGIDGPNDWNNSVPTYQQITGQTFPLSCCDPTKSISNCANTLTINDIYSTGCYTGERDTLELHGIVLIAVMGWIIVVSIVLMYVFEGIEVGSRRPWKKSNSAFDSKDISIETFGSCCIVAMDGRKHYSKLVLRANDFNQFTDGIFDFKYEYEYDIEVQRGEEIMGRAVVETSNISNRKLKLEMEFDEMKGLVTMFY